MQDFSGILCRFSALEEDIRAGILDVINPLEQVVSAVPFNHTKESSWQTASTNWPGFYSLQYNNQQIDIAAVIFNTEESNLRVYNFDNLFGKTIYPNTTRPIGERLKELRAGYEISYVLLSLALLCMFLELLVARETKPKFENPDSVQENTA